MYTNSKFLTGLSSIAVNNSEGICVGGEVKHNYVNNLKMFQERQSAKDLQFSTQKAACSLKSSMIKSRSGGNNLRKYQWEGQ